MIEFHHLVFSTPGNLSLAGGNDRIHHLVFSTPGNLSLAGGNDRIYTI